MSCWDELFERDEHHHTSYEAKETAIDKRTKDILEYQPAKEGTCQCVYKKTIERDREQEEDSQQN